MRSRVGTANQWRFAALRETFSGASGNIVPTEPALPFVLLAPERAEPPAGWGCPQTVEASSHLAADKWKWQ